MEDDIQFLKNIIELFSLRGCNYDYTYGGSKENLRILSTLL